MAPFFIILIPTADIFLDFLSHVMIYINQDKTSLRKHLHSPVVTRLSDIERLLFILGVAAQSAIAFVPAPADIDLLRAVYRSSSNFSLLLLFCPIVIFLGRCTTTFTPKKVFMLVLTAVLAVFLITTSYFFRKDDPVKNGMSILGAVLAILSAAIYLFLLALCFYNYRKEKLNIPTHEHSYLRRFLGLMKRNKGINDDSSETDNELYTNYIPALHMVASVFYLFTGDQDMKIGFTSTFILALAAQIMVLVIELRIRKNEITRGLVRALLYAVRRCMTDRT